MVLKINVDLSYIYNIIILSLFLKSFEKDIERLSLKFETSRSIFGQLKQASNRRNSQGYSLLFCQNVPVSEYEFEHTTRKIFQKAIECTVLF